MIMWVVAAGLALLPVVMNGRSAARFASARWTSHHPRAALLTWQAMGVAGGLAAVGVGLVVAVAPLAAVFPHGAHVLGRQIVAGRGLDGLGPAQVVALAWSATLLTWLLAHTVRTAVRVTGEQRRLRLMVGLVADRLDEHDAYVIPDPRPAAYCVPGRRAHVVLSRGALRLLDEPQLRAVLEHERAHAAGRHDLALLPFLACARAFPWLPWARVARQAVPPLLEMLADDRARRRYGDRVLAEALVRMAVPAGEGAGGAPALADVAVLHRVERLTRVRPPGSRWRAVAACAVAAVLLSGPVAVFLAPLLCVTVWRG
ncbi:M56 family metallopeptidase [Microbispora sp. RL4-1S]|uniref:M56 family metallopeptidase n=1 Tax=Microbispora oryzae TaxID=2806554 RepID=A0A940WMN7_9ACTN|nr:M56 family metallopeptidase [Microbispora oryzae]MBP2706177.1 M56 family metallopeptidase [Microbispora oryzae]